jgi:hypothetical protein
VIKFLIIFNYFTLQEVPTGNWWLMLSTHRYLIGYWPKELLPRLRVGAATVGWGGFSNSGTTRIAPSMGSGHKPDGHYNHAAYFRDLHYLTKYLAPQVPSNKDTLEYVDPSGCFALKNDHYTGFPFWGYTFTFGGPGGHCGD